ncbi:MAG: type I-MYXAN CRISPR-associated protein Cas6/Cmx6 [Sandaracinaceae bacterium]|nr:type I-MYXAN CRISPR-associated protein Cas6/Cmx6 [Sandaracinaceae bacterium]
MTTLELAFPLRGTSLPRDHGYPLYAALASRVPAVHGAGWLGVHPVGGKVSDGLIALGPAAELRVRLPSARVGELLPLAGAQLDIAGSAIRLGAPVVHALAPRSALDARMVLLKLTAPPTRPNTDLARDVLDNEGFADRYRAELGRQLERLEVRCHLELCGRRTMTIKGKRLVGYSVRLTGLDPDGSLRVQAKGLGGRRALGCGLFRPTRGR